MENSKAVSRGRKWRANLHSNCRESKEEANQGSKVIEPTDALRETIERKGWRK